MSSVKLSIENMHCGSCIDHVAKAIRAVKGAEARDVAVGSAEVGFDPAETSPQALTEAGYPARITEGGDGGTAGSAGCSCCAS